MENRFEAREDVLIPAQLGAGGVASNVTVRNVSSYGMMIAGRSLPEAGVEVELLRGRLAVRGRIVWSNGGQCGVRTRSPVDPAALRRGLAASPAPCAAPHRAPRQADARNGEDLLDRLKEIHRELLDSIAALEALTGSVAPPLATLADVRWKLTRASAHRMKFIEETIGNGLADRLSPTLREELDALRRINCAKRAASNGHVTRWTAEGAVREWPDYSRVSRSMTAAMREHVALEARILDPILKAA